LSVHVNTKNMPGEPHILSYARPSSGVDDPAAPDATVFTFASPPVRTQIVIIVTCFVVCALGAVVMIGLGIGAWFDRRQREDGTIIGCLIGLAIAIGIVVAVRRELKRLRRFGQQDVRLEVTPTMLLAWSPQQWGNEPRTLPIGDVRSISAHNAGHVVGGVPIFQIHVRRVRWLTTYWAIRVAVADKGVINRSIADLNHALARARAAPE
jgi:hypothetical protein